MVIASILRVRSVMVVHLHGRHMWRATLTHVVRALLKVKWKLMLMRHVWHCVRRVGGCCGLSGKRVSFHVFFVCEVHGRVGLLVVLQLAPGWQGIKRRSEATIVVPFTALRRADGLDVSKNIALIDINSLGLAADKLTSRRGLSDIVHSRTRAGSSARLAGGIERSRMWAGFKLMTVGVQLGAHVAGQATVAAVESRIAIVRGASRWCARVWASWGLRELLLLNISESLSKRSRLLLRQVVSRSAIIPKVLLMILLLGVLLSLASMAIGCWCDISGTSGTLVSAGSG